MRSIAALILLMGLFLVMSALVASCAPDKSAPELEIGQAPTVGAEDVLITDAGITAEEMVAEIEPFTDVECLDCHTDEVALQELAKPEESTESLSTGPG
ncbi:MAG: hypothetical protein K8L91_00140 [Anaerolineae bacterium]|nr:hypothetical protein [Anaerolineae bacterium]